MEMSYVGWRIQAGVATRQMGESLLSVELSPGQTALLEGWWGGGEREPPSDPVCVSGMCLWDARWQLEFAIQGKGASRNPAVRRSLALPGERADCFARLEAGKEVVRAFVPRSPGTYLQTLLKWQVEQFRVLNPRRILYHVPVLEYQEYIRRIQAASVKSLELQRLVEQLDDFIRQALELQSSIFGDLMERVEYIRPLECGAQTVEESWSFPYLHPEVYGADHASLIGVEDLIELRMVHEVWSRTGVRIPTRVGVLGNPHPYIKKELSGDEVVIDL